MPGARFQNPVSAWNRDFALLAGGTLFGFTGILLAVPAAAVIGVLVRFVLESYRDSRLYEGLGDDAGDRR